MRSRRRRIEWAILAVLAVLAVPAGLAFAAEVSALDKGADALKRGRHAQAVELLNEEMKAQGRPIELRARAYYLRAKAYAALKQPALARADVTIALWLKKLSGAESAEAERLRSQLQPENAAPTAAQSIVPVSNEQAAPGKTTQTAPKPAAPAHDAPLTTAGVAPVTSQPLEPVKVASPAPVSAAEARKVPRTTAVVVPPPSRGGENGTVADAVPAWTPGTSVARANPVEAAPGASSAPAAIAPSAASRPQRPAWTSSGDIETGSLKSLVQPSAAESPAPTETRWQSNVAAAPAAASPRAPPPQAAEPPRSVTPAAVMTQPPPQPATPVAFAPADAATPEPQSASAPSAHASGLPLIGTLFEKVPSPYEADIAEADELQRRRFEKLRSHNEAVRTFQSVGGGTQ